MVGRRSSKHNGEEGDGEETGFKEVFISDGIHKCLQHMKRHFTREELDVMQ